LKPSFIHSLTSWTVKPKSLQLLTITLSRGSKPAFIHCQASSLLIPSSSQICW
ncbi:15392_t:CDS:1, partial [Racocetra persica]